MNHISNDKDADQKVDVAEVPEDDQPPAQQQAMDQIMTARRLGQNTLLNNGDSHY